ncbi:MAG: hypothetical protein WCV67_08815 [Victivallaceae bacterium]|jgi:hypothetical protein
MNAIYPKHWARRADARKEGRFGPRTINPFGAKYHSVSRGHVVEISAERAFMHIAINYNKTGMEEEHA